LSPCGLGPRARDLTFLAETILEDLRSQSAGNKREPLGGSEKFLRNESGLPRNKIAPGPNRRRKNRAGIRRPRMVWRTIEVIPRSENSDEEIQNRLNKIASSVYEQAGTAYPPGSLFLIINLRYFRFQVVLLY
jgi:hypothetical protein